MAYCNLHFLFTFFSLSLFFVVVAKVVSTHARIPLQQRQVATVGPGSSDHTIRRTDQLVRLANTLTATSETTERNKNKPDPHLPIQQGTREPTLSVLKDYQTAGALQN